MKHLRIAACIASLLLWTRSSAGQSSCQVTVAASVELAGGEFSLADVLPGDTCPALRRAASGMHLGRAPLSGSVRVLSGDEVRALLRKLAGGSGNASGAVTIEVPERIAVRRAGARASCADIGARILGSARDAGRSSPRQMECGAADRIPQDTLLERSKTVWDSTLGSWDVFTRCVHPGDCVPFLVRVPGGEFPPEIAPSARQVNSSIAERAMAPSSAARATLPVGKPLVLPGEAVTLLWDQDGIRLVVPAVCLDAGGPGQAVRARIARGGRMVRAIVVSAGKLRTAS
jgi:hypothetical protein